MNKLLMIVAIAIAPTFASAHSWYDSYCCSGDDCAPIAQQTITDNNDGTFTVTLNKGDHKMITDRPLSRVFRWPDNDPANDHIWLPKEALRSLDQDFHACVFGYQIVCAYVPELLF